MYTDDFLLCSIIGKLDTTWYNLYDKSRMMGDYHVRFCERDGVQFPVPTRLCDL